MLHSRVRSQGKQSSEASPTPPAPEDILPPQPFSLLSFFNVWKAVSKLELTHWTMDWKPFPCQPLAAGKKKNAASPETHYFQSMLQTAIPSISKTASAKNRIDASIRGSWNLLKVKVEKSMHAEVRARAGTGWSCQGTSNSLKLIKMQEKLSYQQLGVPELWN